MKEPIRQSVYEKLLEDSGSAGLAGELLPFINAAAKEEIRPASALQKQHLIRILRQETVFTRTDRSILNKAKYVWLVLKSQARVVKSEIWLASLLIFAVGLFVTLFAGNSLLTMPFVLIAPVVAAIGVAFIYGTEAGPALEIVLSTPVSPHVILLSRLTLIYCFNLLMGLAASAVLVAVLPGLSFWPLVTLWLAPMTFLSALSLLSSVLSNNPGWGIFTSLGLWVILNVLRGILFSQLQTNFLSYGMFIGKISPFLWAAALLMIVIALRLAGNEEHHLRLPG